MTEIFIAHTERYRDDESFEKAFSQIPECRREDIERMQNPVGKRLLLATGVALAEALKSRGIDPETADIRKTKLGQPYLYGSKSVFFSLSHSGNIGVCSVSGSLNGVDAELTGRASTAIASRFFTMNENKFLASFGDYDYYFTRLWTLKESFSKYVGAGLSVMSTTEIDMRGVPRVLRSQYDCDPRFFEFTYGEYQISLCTDDTEKAVLVEV